MNLSNAGKSDLFDSIQSEAFSIKDIIVCYFISIPPFLFFPPVEWGCTWKGDVPGKSLPEKDEDSVTKWSPDIATVFRMTILNATDESSDIDPCEVDPGEISDPDGRLEVELLESTITGFCVADEPHEP